MIGRLARCLGVGLLALALAPASRGDQVTFGNVNSGEANTFPFGGIYQDSTGGTEYQQVYAGPLFGGPVTISAITFYTLNFPGEETNADGTYTLSLSTTSAPVNGLNTNMPSNIGPDDATFFSGSLPAYVPSSTMTFTLATPFTFNPALGNLLLDVTMTGVTNNSVASFVAQNGSFGDASSRMVNGTAIDTSSWGLVTTFTAGPAGVVPEPGSLTLAITGMAAVAGVARRRRRVRS